MMMAAVMIILITTGACLMMLVMKDGLIDWCSDVYFQLIAFVDDFNGCLVPIAMPHNRS